MSERESDDRVAEPRSPYGDQDEWGNSIDALKANLKLTPMERLRKAEAMGEFVEKYRGAAWHQS